MIDYGQRQADAVRVLTHFDAAATEAAVRFRLQEVDRAASKFACTDPISRSDEEEPRSHIVAAFDRWAAGWGGLGR